ncbi:hypothetical protein DEI91_09590 [Curtobacterium sp. MCBD17_032]|nr:hypothetical protein DEI91_09590 [Curtobacterium sp. MCBD17_032]
MLVAMAVAGAFAGLYIGLQQAPTPHHLPVAVVGSELADAASAALGGSADVHAVDSAAAARALVRSHDVVAALVPGADGSTLAVAGADGRSATGAATAMLTRVADAGGVPVTRTQDIVPLVAADGQGIAGFYLVFGTTLAAFVLAQIMNSLGALAGLRVRVVVTVIGSIAAAVVVAVIAGPVDGAVPAATGVVIGVLALLAVAVSLSTLAVTALLGPIGVVVSTLVFTTLGNATSGATVSTHLLPPLLSAVGGALPPGAAFGAVTAASYFDGAGTARALLTLGLWIVGATIVVSATAARRRRRELTLTTPARTADGRSRSTRSTAARAEASDRAAVAVGDPQDSRS